eukprot:5139563-Prymnesium_polylepis.1
MTPSCRLYRPSSTSVAGPSACPPRSRSARRADDGRRAAKPRPMCLRVRRRLWMPCRHRWLATQREAVPWLGSH